MEEDKFYNNIKKAFEDLPENFSILEERIDIEIQMKYFEFSKKLKDKDIAEACFNNREELFDIEVEEENGKTVLKGYAVSEKAFKELKSYADSKKLSFDVELLPAGDFDQNPWGVVALSACNIRGGARHSAELVTQAVMGTPVKVYTKVGGWYLVQTPDRYFGWVDDAAIALKTNEELAEWKNLDKVLYKKQFGTAYSEANDKSAVECDLVLANLLSIVGEENGFYKTVLADGREAFVKQDECILLDIWKQKSYSTEDILNTAFGFKGAPYLWGGTSAKMVDCSGFTKSTYYYHGILLQRDASQQTLYGELVETESGYDKLQPGDLVFFGKKAAEGKKERVTHVGIAIGDEEFIHASGKVRINSLNRNSKKYTEYYETAFVRARRIIDNDDAMGIEWVVDNAFYKEILK